MAKAIFGSGAALSYTGHTFASKVRSISNLTIGRELVDALDIGSTVNEKIPSPFTDATMTVEFYHDPREMPQMSNLDGSVTDEATWKLTFPQIDAGGSAGFIEITGMIQNYSIQRVEANGLILATAEFVATGTVGYTKETSV